MIKQIARKAIEEEAQLTRAEFDGALLAELLHAYAAIDAAYDAESLADVKLLNCGEAVVKQKAFAIAAFRKSLNDLLGCIEMLRSGYFDLAQGIERSAIEGFAMAILIDRNIAVFEAYRRGEFSVNKAVWRFVKDRALVRDADAEQILRVYGRLHKMAHPTVAAVAVQFSPNIGGVPVGGVFSVELMSAYQTVIQEVASVANNIEGYLRSHFH
jgi:hypothetical protein